MAGTMTFAGLDVHARSTHAAAIDAMTGELTPVRFGAGVTEAVAWPEGLPGPVRACYAAGSTGCGLYRAAGRGRGRFAGDRRRSGRLGARLIASRPIAGTPSCLPDCCWPGR